MHLVLVAAKEIVFFAADRGARATTPKHDAQPVHPRDAASSDATKRRPSDDQPVVTVECFGCHHADRIETRADHDGTDHPDALLE